MIDALNLLVLIMLPGIAIAGMIAMHSMVAINRNCPLRDQWATF